MNDNKFLESVMDENHCRTLTICGSAKFRNLKEKYQAFYTIKNNLVFAPVNYLSIKKEVEITVASEEVIAKHLANIHDKKMLLSEGIIVVNENGYIGSHTLREICFAYENDKRVLFTHVPHEDREKYYFNHNQTYPLYMLKEEYS